MPAIDNGLIVVDTHIMASDRTRRLPVPPEQRKSRLQMVAARFGISQQDPRVELLPPQISTHHRDHVAVQEALSATRLSNFQSKAHIFRRKPSNALPKPKEATSTLERIIQDGCSAGQAKALIESGADVNISKPRKAGIWRSIRGQKQEEIKSNVLETAVECCSADVIAALAPSTDFEHLDRALGIALAKRDLNSVKVLLHFGADPNLHRRELRELVRNSETPFIVSMASAQKRINSSVATEELLHAVSNRDLRCVGLLLWHGADVNHNGGAAVASAVSSRSPDIVAALCLAPVTPSPKVLALTLPFISTSSQPLTEIDLCIVEMILAAGAEGPETEEALANAVEHESRSLADLMVAYGTSTSPKERQITDVQSISRAIVGGDLQLYGTLLSRPLHQDSLRQLLPFAQSRRSLSPQTRSLMITALLQHEPVQETLDSCLLEAAKNEEVEEAELLAKHGASADYQDGQALFVGTSRNSINLFSVLASTTSHMRIKLRAMKRLRTKERAVRLPMIKTLLNAGTAGVEVDETLLFIMKEREPSGVLDYALMECLVGVADVNVNSGKCFEVAAGTGDIRATSLLLEGRTKPSSIGHGLSAAFSVQDTEKRFEIMQMLADQYAKSSGFDEALVKSVDENQASLRFLKLLLGQMKAHRGKMNAEPLLKAVNCRNLQALKLMTEHKTPREALDRTLREILLSKNNEWRLRAVGLLLAKDLSQHAIDAALVNVMGEDQVDCELVNLILSASAQVDFNGGQALMIATERKDLASLHALCSSQRLPLSIVQRALAKVLNHQDEGTRLTLAEKILTLQKSKFGSDLSVPLGFSLRNILDVHNNDLAMLRLFLDHGADVEIEDSLAVATAVHKRNIPALRQLLSHAHAASTFSKAWKACEALDRSSDLRVTSVILDEIWKIRDFKHHKCIVKGKNSKLVSAVCAEPANNELIDLLLKHQASVHALDSECLFEALKRLESGVLDKLLMHAKISSVTTRLFNKAVLSDMTWSNTNGLLCIEVLLRYRVDRAARHEGLIQAIKAIKRTSSVDIESFPFVDLLLENGANPDFQDGQALLEATDLPNVRLWKRLLTASSLNTSLEKALPYLIERQSHNENTLEILGLFWQKSRGTLNVDSIQIERQQSLVWSVANHDDARYFINFLDMGSSVDQKCQIILDANVGEEEANVLHYALYRLLDNPQSIFFNMVVEQLVTRNAELNFRTSRSGKTPLILAVEGAPCHVVELLIRHGAESNIHDQKGQSPLFHASRRGEIAIVKHLLHADARPNDGSLNEAVRLCNADCVALLLDWGHDPNFPSPLDENQCPLEQLITARHLPNEGWKITDTIKALIDGKANQQYQSDGKSLLLLGLDSPNAERVTTALLVAFMGDQINDQLNEYHNQGEVMSARSYVSLERNKAPSSSKRTLLRILDSYGAKELWYRENGAQPDGYTRATAPRHIVQREDRRREKIARLEEERRDRLRLQAHEDEDRRRRIESRNAEAENSQKLRQQEHKLAMAWESERAQRREETAERAHAGILGRDRERAAQEEEVEQRRRNGKLEHQRREGQLQLEFQQQQDKERNTMLQLESRARVGERRDLDAMRYRLLDYEDTLAKRHHSREMESIKAKGKVVLDQKKLLQESKEQQNLTRRSQLALAFEDSPD